MEWVDVCGAPGSGKSTLCDEAWPPRAIKASELQLPPQWHAFERCTQELLGRIARHPSARACASMTRRSFGKMNAVHRLDDPRVYIQTGFTQRAFGIAWRLRDPREIAPYIELMPLSLGVVVLWADEKTLRHRNVERGKDRSAMLDKFLPAMEVSIDLLRKRGARVLDLDATEDICTNAGHIAAFAHQPSLVALS